MVPLISKPNLFYAQVHLHTIPTVADEIAEVVSVLVDNHVPFAICPGGHSPNPSDFNTDSGVLISLSNFDKVSYDAAASLASIGPGARWDAMYTELYKYNRSMVGGRVMDVGIGGLALGSGLSYLTDLYGMVCDNIVSYQVVLENGRVVEASTTSNSDLFWALKGGSSNFGVVTNFIAKTYPIYQRGGSIQLFTTDEMSVLLQALYEYQTTPNKDPYANMIICLVPTNETTGTMTLHELMALFPPTSLPGWSMYVHSFTPDPTLYDELASFYATAPELAAISALQAGSFTAASNGGAGNALGLQPVNQTWWTVTAAWWNAEDDDTVYEAIASFSNKVHVAADAAGTNPDYIFMNDAKNQQPIIASCGDSNMHRLRAAQRAYDPYLIFQKLLLGGQQLP
ncbi:putative FAD-binding oxidoreductase [Xylaria acuta]|nr:putative FAD-binding oxidoreductase [Xylaria acuta]